MSGYREDVSGGFARKRARPLYLELKSLGVDLRVEAHLNGPHRYMLSVGGLRCFSPAHADRIARRAQDNAEGLIHVILTKRDPDLEAVRREGSNL